MKNITQLFVARPIKYLGLLSVAMLIHVLGFAQLSGSNYTINKNLATGGLNYNSFAAFANAVSSLGVSGPVTVTVERGSGPYTEQVTLRRVNGASANNTITIDGNGEELNFSPNTTDRFIVRFESARFYRLKNLLIRGTNNTFGWGIHMWQQSDDNVIENVEIDLSAITNTTAANAVGIAMINSATAVGQQNGANAYRNIIRDCYIHGSATGGPVYGINLCGTSGQLSDNQFINNRIEDFFSYGFYTSSIGGTVIRGNTISRPRRTAQTTIYGFYCINNQNPDNIIEENITTNMFGGNPNATNAFYAWAWATPNTPANRPWIVRNNIIANIGGRGQRFAFSCSFIQNALFYHNTISFDDNPSVTGASLMYGFNFTGNVNSGNVVKIFNNIISITKPTSGTVYGFRHTSATANYELDYNCYDIRNSVGASFIGETPTAGSHSVMEDWVSVEGVDKASIFANPTFADMGNFDFSPRNNALNDFSAFLTEVPRDILGVTRKTTGTEPGAIEVPFDAEIVSASIPNVPYCSGDQPTVSMTVRNFGEFDLLSTVFEVSINNGAVRYFDTVSVVIRDGDQASFTLSKPLPLMSGSVNDIRINFANPDDKPSNDTARFSTPFVGLGPTGGNLTVNMNSNGMPPEGDRDYWITNPEEPIVFNLSRPTNYTNSQFGTAYTIEASARALPSRTVLPANASVYTHNPITGGTWTINAPVSFIDSMVELSLRIIDIQSNCDTFILRKMLIAPAGNPGFKVPASVCVGTEVELENESLIESGYMDYEWNFGNGKTSKQTNGFVTYTTQGTYQITLKTKTVPFGYEREITKTIQVVDGPIADFSYESNCFGSAVTFTNQTDIGGAPNTYHWQFGDGLTSTQTNPTKNYALPGLYTVTLTATRNGCSTTKERNVAQFEQPVADFSIPALQQYCQHNRLFFENKTSNVSGKIGYLWSFDDQDARSTQEDGWHAYETFGTKNIKLVVTTPLGCKDSIIKTLNIEQGPRGDFTIEGNCQNKSIVFTSNDQPSGSVTAFYKWSIDNEFFDGKQVQQTFATAARRFASVEVDYSNGCGMSSIQAFEIKKSPSPAFSAETICSDRQVVLSNQTTWSDGNISYTWDLGNGETSSQIHPQTRYAVAGAVNVTLTAKIEDGCEQSITQELNVNPSPNRCGFEIKATGVNGLRNYTFTPSNENEVGAENGVNYSWDFGDGTTSSSSIANRDFTADGVYTVQMIASTDAGCSCKTTQQVVVDRLGTQSLNDLSKLAVYPNPSNGDFVLELVNPALDVQVELLNLIGEKVADFNHSHFQADKLSISVPHLAKGVYLLTVKQAGIKSQTKVNFY